METSGSSATWKRKVWNMSAQAKKKKTVPRRFTAAEKCRAVLALWTERLSVSDLCRELGVTWSVLSVWQEQAMDGMLQALEPKRMVPVGPSMLNSRLRGLLERKTARPVPEQDPDPEASSPAKPLQSKQPPPIQRKPPQDRTKGDPPKEKVPEGRTEAVESR